MEEYFDLAYKLHDMLLKSKEYKDLKEKEALMLNDKEASSLISAFKEYQAKSKENTSEEFNKKYHAAKLAMDNHPLVEEYKKAYKAYSILLANITDVVFEDFSTRTTIDKILNNK